VEVRLQGQRGSEYQGVHVIDAESGSLVGEVPAPDSEYPVYRAIDVCAYMGRMARIEIVDERKAGSSGWIGVSSILSTDYPQSVPQ
jgi:hypothetical protein